MCRISYIPCSRHRQLPLDLARLHERQQLEELVAGAEAARRHHQAHALDTTPHDTLPP